MTAKDFFESVREAAKDAERCRNLLNEMEQRALRISSPSFEPRVRATASDVMAKRVGDMVDREAALHARIESDYALIDQAHRVLYGDTLDDGLASIAPRWWADVLCLHYVDGLTWAQAGAVVGYCEQYTWQSAKAALETLDAHGMTSAICGHGFAEDAACMATTA